MLLHAYTNKKINSSDNIQLVKKIGYKDNQSNSIHNFYLEVNGEDYCGAHGFNGEIVNFEYDFEDFLQNILPDKIKTSLIKEEKIDYFFDTDYFGYTLKIEVDEELVEEKIKPLRIQKKIQDDLDLKSFRIDLTKKLLNKDCLSSPIGYCEDEWNKDILGIGYFESREKFSSTFACPFDNNLILGNIHDSNDIGWGCSNRCELYSLTMSPTHKELLLTRHLENLKNDIYNTENLSQEHKTQPLLTDAELKELDIILNKAKEEKQKQWEIEAEHEKKYLVKFNGCSLELFKDLKNLNDNNILTKFEDFEFIEDKIYYHYIDYDFFDSVSEINKDNILFSIMPSIDNSHYKIMLGNGCCIMVEEEITKSNKKALKDFYNRCKAYKLK